MRGLFHIHSNYSLDGKCSLSELVKFCTEKHFGFIVLTEHAEDFNESKMQLYVRECQNLSNGKVIVLPGLEFGFEEYPNLHLLGVGVKKYIGPKDISTTVEEIHLQNGLAIIAHPSRNNHYIPEEIIKTIDGLEIWNAGYDSRYLPNHKSLKLYSDLRKTNHSLIAFSGLDMHNTEEFRKLTLLVYKAPRNEYDLIACLKEGHFLNKGIMLRFKSKPKISLFTQLIIQIGRSVLNLVDFIYWKALGLRKRYIPTWS